MHIDNLNCLGPAVRAELEKQMAQRKQQKTRKEHCKHRLPEGFDSQAEANFYYAEVWPKIHSGQIVDCEVHKTFLLLPPSEYCGLKLHKAEYTPDFVLTYKSGLTEVVEVKSKAIRRLQQSYVYRRRLFIDKYARPQGWTFREVIVD